MITSNMMFLILLMIFLLTFYMLEVVLENHRIANFLHEKRIYNVKVNAYRRKLGRDSRSSKRLAILAAMSVVLVLISFVVSVWLVFFNSFVDVQFLINFLQSVNVIAVLTMLSIYFANQYQFHYKVKQLNTKNEEKEYRLTGRFISLKLVFYVLWLAVLFGCWRYFFS
ncbi:hypothetical protein LROSL1_2215 [Furfurilactobacillus rossiae]|nr:hypothetical protein LROSL1_2215 [Furfurilactobacillus rossiae]